MSIADWLFDNLYLLAAGICAAAFLLLLLHLLSSTLFGLQHMDFIPLERREPVDVAMRTNLTRILFIDFSWSALMDLRTELAATASRKLVIFDLSRDRDKLRADFPVRNGDTWIVTGLEGIIMDRTLRRRALDLLERLTDRPNGRLFFFSEVSPLARLRQAREREKQDLRDSGDKVGLRRAAMARESFRWSDLFADFTTFYGAPPQPDPAWIAQDGVDLLLNQEFGAIPSSKVRDQRVIMRDPSITEITRETVIAYIANYLGDYYQRQWVKSSKEEHLAMHHLAHGRYINAANFVVLDNLLLRGLVRRDPDFRLMNESFAHWIRLLEHPQWFEEFRQSAERAGPWQLMRVPLLLAIITSVTLLAYVDSGGSGSLLALLPAVAAAVPLVLSQLASARQNLQ